MATDKMPHMTANDILERTEAYREHFGMEQDPTRNLPAFIDAATQLNPRYKGERTLVRYELEGDTTEYKAGDRTVILETAEALRMVGGEVPLAGEYDVIAALGGARRAPWDRAAYAAEAITSGKASGELWVAGSTRPLGKGEAEAALDYAPANPQTEADLVQGAARRITEAYGIPARTEVVDDPRAHTEAIVEKVLRAGPEIGRLALVTTMIYWGKTCVQADRVGSRYGVAIAVAGQPSAEATIASRTAATYQAEISSFLVAAGKSLS